MNNLDSTLEQEIALFLAIFLCFILVLFVVGSLAKDSCIEKLKDKTALEINLICD